MSIKNSNNVKDILKKIEYYCNYQERSHREVTEKLYKMGIKKTTIDEMLANLIQNDFLNEARFAKQYTNGKFKIKFWGKKRIKYGLKKHNISDYNIRDALKNIKEEDYKKTLNNITLKVLGSCQKENLKKKKEKVFLALKYRGWESDLIYEQIKKINEANQIK